MTAGLATVQGTNAALDDLLEHCLPAGVDFVELPADRLERAVGAPVPTVPIEPPPVDAIELGLLELEQEVLQDSYELARATYTAQLRDWRRTTSLVPAGAVRRAWEAAGLRIRFVAWDGLDRLTDAEIDYACRLAAAVGADAVVTDMPPAAAVRHASASYRVPLAIRNTAASAPLDLELLLARGPGLAAAVDLAAWFEGRHGPPFPWIEEHVDSIVQLRVTAAGMASAPFGRHTPAIVACLEELRAAGIDLPVVIEGDEVLRAAALARVRG